MASDVSFLDILVILLLVFLNGFFVAAEFAIVKVRGSQIDLKAKDGSANAKMAKHIVRHLDGYLAATQLGITLASLGLGWLGEATMSKLILNFFHFINIPISETGSHAVAAPIAFAFITILHIVFGELAPKSLAIQRPIGTSLNVAYPLHFFYLVFRPFIWILNGLANVVLKLIGIDPAGGHDIHTSEELQLILDQGKESGALEHAEHELIQNVFDFQERIVKNIMIPRTKIAAIDIKTSPDDVVKTVVNEGYTRLPVYDKTIDNIIGILHSKDVLARVATKKPIVLKDMLRMPLFTPESKKISDLLTELRTENKPIMAIVIDEFGGTAGMVTLEDIVEELVGEIQDEYDEEKPIVEVVSDGEFIVNALAPIDDVNKFLPTELPEDDDYDSVAGFMNVLFEKIPEVGESIDAYGYNFTILKKSNRMVESVRITKFSSEPGEGPE
ncbi:hemolysin family protein [Solitalea koreensis]|uniref:Hemolysin, contains CBS domains n=1 Tax=Solitalea koreensis TaxID=543615 RepID=A0A521C6R0_9SPHI|nr:hemolysin family protein [Solitalea koreensis]SMO55073.1 Hemolysin, contains CBS domains [Solitalea koreensis]